MRTYLIVLIAAGMALAPGRPPGASDRSDIDAHRSCTSCGMDRKAYGFSRTLIKYADGAETGLCSLHCAVAEMLSQRDRAVARLLVADRDSRELLEAEHAVWVSGGNKRGVMTVHPVWAFSSVAGAAAFVADNGGTITPWAAVFDAVRDEVSRERR